MIPVSRISDEAFASGAMGDGVGIRPAEGRVYAPFDGTAEAVFPTGHAVGLKSEEGWEVLIHIGVDTVQLNGKGFSPLIRQGEHVKKGQPLVEFDREQIAAQGYDATVIYVVTNIPDEMYLQAETGKMTDALENVMYIKSRE